jgi:putative acetyltransferase
MRTRDAGEDDLPAILNIHRSAFDRDDEAALVRQLLQDETAQPLVSCVAEVGGALVGHGLFTAMHLTQPASPVRCAILAPLAVLPEHQRQGVGRALIEAGCHCLQQRQTELVFVLGDPAYYMRCGFQPAVPLGLQAPYRITPEAAWMVRALMPEVLGHVRGTVACARSLQPQAYWQE